MTTTIKNIIPAKYAENTQTTQYTAVNLKAIIDKFTATNVTSDPVVLSVNIVTALGTVSSSNLIIDTITIPSGDTYLCPELVGQVLSSNDYISTLAGTSSSITISAAGREVT